MRSRWRGTIRIFREGRQEDPTIEVKGWSSFQLALYLEGLPYLDRISGIDCRISYGDWEQIDRLFSKDSAVAKQAFEEMRDP